MWPLDSSSSSLKKWSWAKSFHRFQNFVMIRIIWGTCTYSKYKFPISLQAHWIRILRGRPGSHAFDRTSRWSLSMERWETKSWTTPTAVLIWKFHDSLHISWIIKYFDWSYGAWNGDGGKKNSFYIKMMLDLRIWGGGGVRCDRVREWHGYIYTTECKIAS